MLHVSHPYLVSLSFNWRAGASQPSRSFERIFLSCTSCKCACTASLRASFSFPNYSHTLPLHSTACAAILGDWPTLYLFPFFMVRRCNFLISSCRYCCMPAACLTTSWKHKVSTYRSLLTCSPFCQYTRQIYLSPLHAYRAERRRVDLSCFTKALRWCSPNIAAKSRVGSLLLANNVQHFH